MYFQPTFYYTNVIDEAFCPSAYHVVDEVFCSPAYHVLDEAFYLPICYEPPTEVFIIDGFNLIFNLLNEMNIKHMTRKNIKKILTTIFKCFTTIFSNDTEVYFIMKKFKHWQLFKETFLSIFVSEEINYHLYCAQPESSNDTSCDDRFVHQMANFLSCGNTNVTILSNDKYRDLHTHINKKTHGTYVSVCEEIPVDLNTEPISNHCQYELQFMTDKNTKKITLCFS